MPTHRVLALSLVALALTACADPTAPATITSSLTTGTTAMASSAVATFRATGNTVTITRTFTEGQGCGATFSVEPEVRPPNISVLLTTLTPGSACPAGQTAQYTVTLNNVPTGYYAPVRLSEKPSVDGNPNLVALASVNVPGGLAQP